MGISIWGNMKLKYQCRNKPEGVQGADPES
jgi:hypothetical protein